MDRSSFVLVNTQLWQPHIADALEVVWRLSESCKQVYVAFCRGQLSTCPANSSKKIITCIKCNMVTDWIEKELLPVNAIVIELELSSKEDQGFIIPHFRNMRELLEFKYQGAPIGMLVASQLSDDEDSSYFDVGSGLFQERIQKHISSAVHLYNFGLKKFKELNISDVYVWNGRRPVDGPLLFAAIAQNRNYYAFISGGVIGNLQIINATSVQEYDEIKMDIDQLYSSLSSGKRDLEKEAEEYFSSYIGGGLNQVGYVNYSNNNSDHFVSDNDKPILLYVSSSPREQIHMKSHYDFFGDDHYHKVLDILNSDLILENFKVVVRWHPGKRSSCKFERDKIESLSKTYSQFHHFLPESNVNTYEIVSRAEYIATTGSTVGHLASFLGKKVIFIGPASVMVKESVFPCNTQSELEEALMNEWVVKDKIGAIKFAVWAKNFGSKMRFIDYRGNGQWFLNLKSEKVHPYLLFKLKRLFSSFLSLARALCLKR